MRSQHLMRTAPFAAIVLAAALAEANAPGDQYAVFNAAQTFIIDNKTSLEWQRFVSSQKVDHGTAQTACTNAGINYRLPTVRELLTLVDEDPDYTWDPDAQMQVPTHIDPNAFPGTPSDVFWTMSPGPIGIGSFKVVDFASGETSSLTSAAYVRCVVDL